VKLAVLLCIALAACGDNVRGDISIEVPEQWSFAVGEMARLAPYPITVNGEGGGFGIVVEDDAALPAESYRFEASDAKTWHVFAHDVLGAQYGVAAALESWGFRFRHPYDTLVSYSLHAQPFEALGVVHKPDTRVRGLHLHTLHPIEGYFAFWEPGHTEDAKRIINWLIENRGNYIQWAALDDIKDPARHAVWQAATRELIDYAHARGVRIGLNIQLFGQSNLQLAFDLSDDRTGTVPIADEVAAHLPLVTQDLPFDVYQLSFGEFFSSDPDKFIAAINEVAKQLRALAPAAEMHALVHLGAKQRVTYMGQDLIYYFLVKFADPTIVPDIHTTMYYDLFEDTGGAYQHDDFSEHRAYLMERICFNKPAAYHPESAYWIAFDDSIPTFLPLYAHTRWLDLRELANAQCPLPANGLDEHLLFSTGWEWGYWLNDYITLRSSFEIGGDVRAYTHAALAPDLGDAAADLVDELADTQHHTLIYQRLAPYFASRDVTIDTGRALGIISQPDRVTFDDLAAAPAATRDAFEAGVLADITAMREKLAELAKRADALPLPNTRWGHELRDGFAVDALRAEFVEDLYKATLAQLRGDAAASKSARDAAADLLERARRRVAGRDEDLHDPHGSQLITRGPNQTFYQYGYLFMADTLCFWHRELIQVDRIRGTTTEDVPGCAF
jgi:hypothetical protein